MDDLERPFPVLVPLEVTSAFDELHLLQFMACLSCRREIAYRVEDPGDCPFCGNETRVR